MQLKVWPKDGSAALLPPELFFTKPWAGRGREYRMLVEPLEIAKWYMRVSGRGSRWGDLVVHQLQWPSTSPSAPCPAWA